MIIHEVLVTLFRFKFTSRVRASAPATLDVERLIDGLVANSPALIMGEVELEALRYLLGTPRVSPGTMSAGRFGIATK